MPYLFRIYWYHMKQYILLSGILAFSLLACKRSGEPIPRICTQTNNAVNDLVTIKLGDTLALVNCSEKSTRQRWVMPDGGNSTQETVYFIPSNVDTYTVRLFVSNNDFVNEYQAIQRVAVIP